MRMMPTAARKQAPERATKAQSATQAQHWLEENGKAIQASNAWVEEHGLPLAKHRQF